MAKVNEEKAEVTEESNSMIVEADKEMMMI